MTDQSFEVQFNLSGADLERLIVVGSDLEFLRDLSRDHLPSHTEVRLAAGVLRRLLVDGLLAAVWRPICKTARVQPTVEVTEIDSVLSKWPVKWLRYGWAGGATSTLAHHNGTIVAAIPEGDQVKYGSMDEFVAANPLPTTGEKRTMTVKDWLASTSVAIRTNEVGIVRISRRSVLKYIANRKGGVHFDPKRDLTAEDAKRRRAEIEHHLLDHGLVRVGHLSGSEYEVVSMAQAVASSDWAQQLIETARGAAPEDFHGDPHELKIWTGMREADGTGWATWHFGPKAGEQGSE